MDQITSFLKELKRLGIADAWLVGGVVRDWVRKRPSSDVDIVCNESNPEIIASKIHGAIVGKHPQQIVTKRMKEQLVEIIPMRGMCIEDDLRHRDFTINAMAADINGEIIDPFGGVRDIEHNTLRLVPAPVLPYEDDPVRVLRLLRFASFLGYTIEEETRERTVDFIKNNSDRIRAIPKERLGKEFINGFAYKPFDFLKLIEDYNLLPLILPEVETLRGVKQSPIHHPEGDVLAHTFLTLREAQEIIRQKGDQASDIVLGLAALLHDIGKPASACIHPKLDRISFFGHESAGMQIASKMITPWAMPEEIRASVLNLINHHMQLSQTFTERTAVKLIRRIGAENAKLLFVLALCDARGSSGEVGSIVEARATFDGVMDNLVRAESAQQSKSQRLLNGNEVMEIMNLKPGPWIAQILEDLDVATGCGTLQTKEDALLWLKAYPTDAF